MIRIVRDRFDLVNRQYINPLDRRRAVGLLYMSALLVVAAILAFVILDVIPFLQNGESSKENTIFVVALVVLAFVIQRLVVTGQLGGASWIFVGVVTVGALAARIQSIDGTASIVLLLPLVSAAVFLKRRGLQTICGVILVGVFYAVLNQSAIDTPLVVDPSTQALTDLALVLLALGSGMFFLMIFGGVAEKLASDVLRHDERLGLLQQYRAELSGAADEDAMLVRTWDVLTAKMHYVYMQVHLSDIEGRLNTYVRTGMGTRFASRRTDLPPDNMIRVVNRQGKTTVVTIDDKFEARSHLLPSVDYAVAIPILAGTQILGVLDIQSDLPENPFSDQEITILEMVASELGQGMERNRERLQWAAANEEARRTQERLEAQIVQLRRQIDQTLGSDWLNYLQSRGLEAFGFDLKGQEKTLTPASGLPDHLKPAIARGEMVIEAKVNEQVITIPIKQRDEVLGAMSFGLPLNQKLTDRQIEMAHNVANRLGVALENARLVEQSQALALRERKTGEVAGLLLGQQEVRDLLDTAAESFNTALGAIFTRIHVNPQALITETRNEEVL